MTDKTLQEESKMLESTAIIIRQAKRLYSKLQKLEKNYTKWIPDGHDQFWNQVFEE